MNGDDLDRWLLRAVPDALWVVGEDGTTVRADARCRELLGVTAADAASLRVWSVVAAEDHELLLRAMRHPGPSYDGEDLPVRLRRPDGGTLDVRVRLRPVRDDRGDRRAWLLQLTELTEDARKLAAMERHEANMRSARSLAGVAVWVWEPAVAGVLGGAGVLEQFARPPAPVADLESLLVALHPTRPVEVAAAVSAALVAGPSAHDEVCIEAPVASSDGVQRWARTRGRLTRDEAGRVVRVVGVTDDITKVKETAHRRALLTAVATAANEATTLVQAVAAAETDLLVLAGQRPFAVLSYGPEGVTALFHPREAQASDGLDRDISLALIQRSIATRELQVGSLASGAKLIAAPVCIEGDVPCVVVLSTRSRDDATNDAVAMAQVATLLSHVAERERASSRLAGAKDEAESASLAKSQFLATMSHEIRTPLNGIIGLGGLIAATELDEQQRRYTDGLEAAGRTLLALVDDILDLSKIEAGRLELEDVDFVPRDVVGASVGLLETRAAERGLALTVTVSDSVPDHANGDPVRLGQVVTNLVGNAVKFTSEGSVDVSVGFVPSRGADGAGVLRVEVRDTGVGIAAEQQDRIFDAFAQADDSTTRTFGGTGLGLAICRRIARLMSGDVGVTSTPGEGSTFWFTARLGAAVAVEQLPRRTAAPPRGKRAASYLGRVLVAEDNDINQLVAEGVLRSLGYDVVIAEDGVQALEAVRTPGHGIDLILMDCQMPELDGYAATRAIRELPTSSGARWLPVIALTATALAEERSRCLAAGMDDYLTKPLDVASLQAMLGRWILASTDAPSLPA